MEKRLRGCAFVDCKKTGYTQRSYYFCAEHWVTTKILACMGDSKAEYLTHHAGHAELTKEVELELESFIKNESL